jgi:putative restriction endonuclease
MTRIPTSSRYKTVLKKLRGRLSEKQLKLLQTNYAAPNHTLSVKRLAEVTGYRDAYLQLGLLGKQLCEALDFEPTMLEKGRPVYTQVLADAPLRRSERSWEWTLLPQVVQAIRELGWFADQRATFILTWNPSQWHWDQDEYEQEVRETANGSLFAGRWSSGNTKRISPGDRVFLIRQSTKRGIIGSGFATSPPYQDEHWNGEGDREANYVDCQFDTLVQAEDRLPLERLQVANLGVPWNNLYASGVQVPSDSVVELEQLWSEHLARIGRSYLSDAISPPGEEGAEQPAKRVLREIRERRGQPVFRQRLIDAYQRRCAISGCDALAALEAAHITPYSVRQSNRVSNSLLLRADVHTLFDLNLIGIHPTRLTVSLASSLTDTSYQELAGKRISLPTAKSCRPHEKALRQRWIVFKQLNAQGRQRMRLDG